MTTEKTKFLDLLNSIPNRAAELVIKLLSVKGVILFIATWIYLKPDTPLPTWGWLSIVGIVIFGRDFLSHIKDLRG